MNAEAEEELVQIANRLAALSERGDGAEIAGPLAALQASAEKVGESASGSWLGYQASVYYEGLKKPPSGAHFDQAYGLVVASFGSETSGSWLEYDRETVVNSIHGKAGNPDLVPARSFYYDAKDEIEMCKSELLSILQTYTDGNDPFLASVRRRVDDISLLSQKDAISRLARPLPGTYDGVAVGKGRQTPPHIEVLAETDAINHTRETVSRLMMFTKQVCSHLSRQPAALRRNAAVGKNIFIGHGRSNEWLALKNFIEVELGLQTDEFNRVPIAGVTNVERLKEMLNSAAMAFLVMTGDDGRLDGTSQARLNVVHEAGLFQGRLGFERAIVLLEEGCEEFSNIEGLGQLRFARGDIRSKFEEVRQVLRRERLWEAGEPRQQTTG